MILKRKIGLIWGELTYVLLNLIWEENFVKNIQ